MMKMIRGHRPARQPQHHAASKGIGYGREEIK